MRGFLVLALVALLGCDDSPPSPEDALEGSWALVTSDGCVVGAYFLDERTYELDVICELENGAFGVQAEVGDYSATDTKLTYDPSATSCAGGAKKRTQGYKLDGNTLTFVSRSGATILKKLPDQATSMGAQAVFGCWGDDGEFTPRAIAEI